MPPQVAQLLDGYVIERLPEPQPHYLVSKAVTQWPALQ